LERRRLGRQDIIGLCRKGMKRVDIATQVLHSWLSVVVFALGLTAAARCTLLASISAAAATNIFSMSDWATFPLADPD
jgi:hypothetical protein